MVEQRVALLVACGWLLNSCGTDASEKPSAGPTAGEAGRAGSGARSGGEAGGQLGSGGDGGMSGDGALGGTVAVGSNSSGSGGASSASKLPIGSAECTSASDCVSDVCLPDVTGTPRCCEADCRANDRVCSTGGECVCSGETREVGGECLLVEGRPCREGRQCASNLCADGVCCDASCDRDCERCDAPARAGRCVLYSEDPACLERDGFECSARGRCRLPAALTCGSDADCDSDHCAPAAQGASICCKTECVGVCQRCGATGACDAFPAIDSSCPAVTCPASTACLDYRPPALGACAANGTCAACEALPRQRGVPCGVGSQCDGAGTCRFNGVGRVAAGQHHTCAIRDNGNVVCWGRNNAGQLGAAFDRPLVGDDETPADVPGLEIDFRRTVVQLTAGFAHTCALFDEGSVRCWGKLENDVLFGTVEGLLGTDLVVRNALGFVDPLLTGDVRLPDAAVQISASSSGAHTCALLRSGRVVCWGFNADGQCGNSTRVEIGTQTNEALPLVALGASALEVRAGLSHTCALLEGGRVKCWGEGNQGRLGYGDITDRMEPQGEVAVGAPVRAIAVGLNHTCGLLDGGRVRCWGDSKSGQLGYGHALDIGDDETPEQAVTLPGDAPGTFLGGDVEVGGGGGVVQITPLEGDRAMCARFAGGAVRCWGNNDRGQLGYGHAVTEATRFTPDQLEFRPAPGRFNAGGDLALGGTVLALAESGRCALLVDGRLFCWGRNEYGQLGLPAQFPNGGRTHTPFEMGPVAWE